MKIFAILDKKAGAYMEPFFFPNKGLALRAFEEFVNSEKSTAFKYPADFSIWAIGEYDEKLGVITSLPKPEHVDEALNVLKKAK